MACRVGLRLTLYCRASSCSDASRVPSANESKGEMFPGIARTELNIGGYPMGILGSAVYPEYCTDMQIAVCPSDAADWDMNARIQMASVNQCFRNRRDVPLRLASMKLSGSSTSPSFFVGACPHGPMMST